MALPSLGEAYSLLADAQGAEFKRRRKEEEDYRRKIQRDQIKYALLSNIASAFINPLAKELSTGVGTAISNALGGDRLKTVKESEAYRTAHKKVKLAQERLAKAKKVYEEYENSEYETPKEYYDNVFGPKLLMDELNQAIALSPGAKLGLKGAEVFGTEEAFLNFARDSFQSKHRVVDSRGERTIPLVDKNQKAYITEEKYKEGLANFEEVMNLVKNNTLTLDNWENDTDKLVRKALGADGLIPAFVRKIKGISKEDINSSITELLKSGKYSSFSKEIINAMDTFKKTGDFNQQEVNAALLSNRIIEKAIERGNITKTATETTRGKDGNDLKVVQTTTVTNKLGRVEEVITTDITDLLTEKDRKRAERKVIGTAYKAWYDGLTASAQEEFQTVVNDNKNYALGENSFKELHKAAMLGFKDLSDADVDTLFSDLSTVYDKSFLATSEHYSKQYIDSIQGVAALRAASDRLRSANEQKQTLISSDKYTGNNKVSIDDEIKKAENEYAMLFRVFLENADKLIRENVDRYEN